jgi:hypothetical protein
MLRLTYRTVLVGTGSQIHTWVRAFVWVVPCLPVCWLWCLCHVSCGRRSLPSSTARRAGMRHFEWPLSSRILYMLLFGMVLSQPSLGAELSPVNAVALFDFDAREDDELSVRRGEALAIVGEVEGEDEWVRGRSMEGRIGLIPLNYVRLFPPEDAPEEAAELSVHRGDSTAAALAAAAQAATVDAQDEADDPSLRDAMRRYRRRRALYNYKGPSASLERWGVRLNLDSPSMEEERLAEAGVEAEEHRSGIGGVPFFNIVEYMDDADMSREIVTLLREEWLPPTAREEPVLPGLEEALRAAAGQASRDVILTFANTGYADFVLNGFGRATAPNTLVIALDVSAHKQFQSAGLHSYFDPRMPGMSTAEAGHASAAFMDIMKLRLIYLAEVLLRGYNALLTDADAVFHGSPFAVFPPSAHLVVACDSTVVPRNWREAPGMVMAGFFYARAGPRPIILIKEVLDYQLHHPNEHDQQSFNQILSELLVADLSVSVMHPRLFPNGFQYFVKRTVQREGVSPLVVQNNWIMGAENKRHRFREAGMWSQDADEYFGGSTGAPLRLLRYNATQPFVSGLQRETLALHAALRIAAVLGRVLVLPGTCAFASASGLTPPPSLTYRDRQGSVDDNVLDDHVDADWGTVEWFYDMAALQAEFAGQFRESSFLANPRAAALAEAAATSKTPTFFIEASDEWRVLPPADGATVLTPASLRDGATDDELQRWFAPHAEAPLLELGDLTGRVRTPPSSREGRDTNQDSASELSRRLNRGIVFREEIERYVRQQVQVAAPFECLCVQGPADIDLQANISAIASLFESRVPADAAVFVAGHRVDLVGLEPFREIWEHVFALSLYDWNGSGLQGRQFSSVINRLICQQAERVHFLPGTSPRLEC